MRALISKKIRDDEATFGGLRDTLMRLVDAWEKMGDHVRANTVAHLIRLSYLYIGAPDQQVRT